MTISIASQETSEQQLDNEVVLSVEGVSKKFCRDLKRSLLYGVQDIATELVGIRQKSEKLRLDEFWALKDVSFQLRRGEALGLVGPNGSGKSTLLRIISGLIKPDSGFVEIKGRIAPLIALGAGFNPILTGRENIYANMSILGLSKKEIDERFEAVLDFAEIGAAIDAPVQTYSSGMAARLGFACAIYTEPDILLIDEVLAVGDIKFRAKCYRRLAKLREQGTSFILVSHNSHSILSICESAIYLLKGKVVTVGNTDSVVDKYEKDLFSNEIKAQSKLLFLTEKYENKQSDLNIISLCFKDEQGNLTRSLLSGETTYFCVEFKAYKEIKNVTLSFLIQETFGESEHVLCINTQQDGESWNILPGYYEIQLKMPYLGLKPSFYTLKLSISKNSYYMLDAVESFKFTVEGKGMSQCLFYQPRTWKLVKSHNI
ncbi:MAG: Vitamin B12 import ATP-binding protein BtuD [Chroococcidiopsis sp. SAG 2025]|uniref:ABC transporter ATP-binding protein n=1 Tax=Chroococcidiopsis sp. SAG 2025 TaxID=171389 RepID=UPI0029372EA0|nr:ABC transporter ATP-binding protein [Chroococcidiopsis sp. SAG 2025]MDV2995527.1 Vitamin B12 import ATP-binding protein BtuD [Chroococcidiopsis sp. SAG 2025]